MSENKRNNDLHSTPLIGVGDRWARERAITPPFEINPGKSEIIRALNSSI